MTSPGTARLLWSLAEPFHALTYFAEEAVVAAGEWPSGNPIGAPEPA